MGLFIIMETTEFGFIIGPGDKFEDLFTGIYEAGKVRVYEEMEGHTKTEHKNAIIYYVEENMIGKITDVYGKDQQCFDALGMIHTLAKEQFPDSGIDTVADETFQKMHTNVTGILNMSFESYDPEGTPEGAKRYQQEYDLMNSNFDMIVNDGAEKILRILDGMR